MEGIQQRPAALDVAAVTEDETNNLRTRQVEHRGVAAADVQVQDFSESRGQIRSVAQLVNTSATNDEQTPSFTGTHASNLQAEDTRAPPARTEVHSVQSSHGRRSHIATVPIDYKVLVRGMVKKVSETLSLTPSDRLLLMRLVSVADDIENALYGRAELHIMLTITETNLTNAREAVAAMYSKLFHRALDTRNAASSVTSQALSDAFTVARRGIRIANGALPAQEPDRPKMTVPNWTHDSYVPCNPASGGLRHLYIDDDILASIERMSIDELLSVYGYFFNQLWLACRKEHGWKGSIVYGKLCPDLLRGEVVFLYGPNRASSIPYTYASLPHKGRFKDCGKKIVGSAILAYWVQNEPCSNAAMRWYLAHKNVIIANSFREQE